MYIYYVFFKIITMYTCQNIICMQLCTKTVPTINYNGHFRWYGSKLQICRNSMAVSADTGRNAGDRPGRIRAQGLIIGSSPVGNPYK